MATTDPNAQEKKHKRTVYKETNHSGDTLNSGETSSVADFDHVAFIKKPRRMNRPLGTGHEPGTMPGRD